MITRHYFCGINHNQHAPSSQFCCRSCLGVTGSTISETRNRSTGHQSVVFLSYLLFLHARDCTNGCRCKVFSWPALWPLNLSEKRYLELLQFASSSPTSCFLAVFSLYRERGAGVWRVAVSDTGASPWRFCSLYFFRPAEDTGQCASFSLDWLAY